MKNTKYHSATDEPVIRYEPDHQHKKHLTLLKVFIIFALLAVVVILVLWWTHRKIASVELEDQSRPVTSSIDERAADLSALRAQSRTVTETPQEQQAELTDLANAK